jgi:hypothetical protein
VELFSRKGTAVVSNVPGPKTPLYICGQRITEMYFWVPQSGSMGLGVSLLTYAGQVHVGMIADRNLVAEPQRAVDLFAPELERLRKSIGGLARRSERKAARTREGKPGGRVAAKARENTRKKTRVTKSRERPRERTGSRATQGSARPRGPAKRAAAAGNVR